MFLLLAIIISRFSIIILKMMKPIKIAVKCIFSQAFPFELFPEMTTQELSQFVLNCKILHETKQDEDSKIPVRLGSVNFNPLIDYMLMSPLITIGEVYDVFKYIKTKEDLSLSCLKQSEFERHRYYQKPLILPIVVCYQPKEALKQFQRNQRATYSHRISNKEDENQLFTSKIIANPKFFPFLQVINIDGSTSKLSVSRYILKSDLDCFQKVQKVFLIRKMLIELYNEHTHLFGSLKEISENEDKISFIFDYIPSVSFSEIMHFQFSNSTISYLVNKIWMFLLTLIQNRYESYIYRLFKKRGLRQLFDSICLGINNRLIINNLNILFERGGSERFSPSEHEKLIEEINIYVKLNKSQLKKYDDRVEVDQSSNIHPISIFTFAKIYLTRQYELTSEMDPQYYPKTSIFLWKPQPHTPNNQKKPNMNEATTAKKPKNPMEKKVKKDKSKSLNRSRAHESIKKTKCRKVDY